MTERPRIQSGFDMQGVIRKTEEYIENLEEGKRLKDAEHYIYEAVMEAIYGKDVWGYISSKLT